jgi:hypothetical protein
MTGAGDGRDDAASADASEGGGDDGPPDADGSSPGADASDPDAGADAGPETAAETAVRGIPGAAEPDVDGETTGDRFAPDPERCRLLREVARDVRGESSESEQVAAVLYRVSDLYDPDEETSPEEIYLNVRAMWQVKARGGLERS